ncbi:MAG: polyphosphate--glucose phosphotransferase [Candidatus Limnocylindrales bacterium]
MHEGERLLAIGVDVGGTGIKAALVDVKTGELAGERIRVLTPMPSKPAAVVASAGRVVGRLIRAANAAATTAGQPVPVVQAIGVGFPAPILDGVTKTAANVDPEWVGFDGQAAFSKAFKRRTWLVNDADAAGVAEMRFGAGHGKRGVVIVLTLGTGVGSAIFVDGRLVPNTELGHMEVNGKDAERRSSANARVRRGQSWKAWAEDLDDHLRAIDLLFSPNLIILGGGISKKADRFLPFLRTPEKIVAAELRNEAGIVGAAMVGLERETEMLREERDVAEHGRLEPQPAALKVVPPAPTAEAG